MPYNVSFLFSICVNIHTTHSQLLIRCHYSCILLYCETNFILTTNRLTICNPITSNRSEVVWIDLSRCGNIGELFYLSIRNGVRPCLNPKFILVYMLCQFSEYYTNCTLRVLSQEDDVSRVVRFCWTVILFWTHLQ